MFRSLEVMSRHVPAWRVSLLFFQDIGHDDVIDDVDDEDILNDANGSPTGLNSNNSNHSNHNVSHQGFSSHNINHPHHAGGAGSSSRNPHGGASDSMDEMHMGQRWVPPR